MAKELCDLNVADLLSYADIHQLNRMAQRLECVCDTHSKQQLIQSILIRMKQKGIYGTELNELAKEELLFLMLLAFDRRDWLSLEELTAKATLSVTHTKSSRPIRHLITEALASGWLFRGVSRNTQDLFRIPRDLNDEVISQIRREYGRHLETLRLPPMVYRDEGDSLLSDILLFLNYIHRTEVRLTAEKVIYKRHLQQMLTQMSVREEIPAQSGWRFGYGFHFRYYPDRFSLIHDVCLILHLIKEEREFVELTEKGKLYLASPQLLSLVPVYRTWIRIYKHPIPLLPILTNLVGLLCDGQWVSLSSLFAVMRPWIAPFYYDSPEQVFEQRIIKMMVHMGMLQMATLPEGAAIRLSEVGKRLLEQVRSFEATPIPTHAAPD